MDSLLCSYDNGGGLILSMARFFTALRMIGDGLAVRRVSVEEASRLFTVCGCCWGGNYLQGDNIYQL